MESEQEDRPAKNFSTAKLIQAKNYAEDFIEKATDKAHGTGGWIAREANYEEIERAKGELEIINKELALRK